MMLAQHTITRLIQQPAFVIEPTRLRQKKSQGTTFIELMIVVAIIGILATIAIPRYTNYLKKAKVSEIINLMGGLKTSAEEYAAGEAKLPTDIEKDLGGKTTGKYTAGCDIKETAAGFIIYCWMKPSTGPALADKQVGLEYDFLTKNWICSTQNVPGTPIPPIYLPSACR